MYLEILDLTVRTFKKQIWISIIVPVANAS